MVKKEFSLFLSSATYMLNGGLGLIFTAAVGVIMVIKVEYFSTILAMFGGANVGFVLTEETLAAFVAAILVMLVSMNSISASALSLEGNRFWIVKTMPVSAKSILLAKTAPALIMTLFAALFASVCSAIAVKADFLTTLLLILIPITAAVSNSLVGTVLNAVFPKFKFDNETQVVKQSVAVLIALCEAMLVGLLSIGGAYLFAVKLDMAKLGMFLMLSLNILISIAAYILINRPLSRKIEEYNL